MAFSFAHPCSEETVVNAGSLETMVISDLSLGIMIVVNDWSLEIILIGVCLLETMVFSD